MQATQPEESESLGLSEDGPTRRRFLARLQGEISKRGTIDVLRHGVSHGPHDLKLFYGSPSEANETARERFEQNRFTVTCQLRYSRDETQRALDIALFINGLPVFTFIVDVVKHYTPVESYYRLAKTVEDDPEFDARKAQRKLRRYVERHDHAIRLKAEIMVDHFHEQVLARNRIGGQARAMVVTSGIAVAIQYFHALTEYLRERTSPYVAIVAFSGEHEFGGGKVTEAIFNGFPSRDIADRIQEDPHRFLVCADKFQTGYDEPLLHTMYVDKPLSGIKAVQGERQGLRSDLQLPVVRPALHPGRLGGALDLSGSADPEAAVAARGRPVARHPGSDRHGELPGREAGGARSRVTAGRERHGEKPH